MNNTKEYWKEYIPPFHYSDMNVKELKNMARDLSINVKTKNIYPTKRDYINSIKNSKKIREIELMFQCYTYILDTYSPMKTKKFIKTIQSKRISPPIKTYYILSALSICLNCSKKNLELKKKDVMQLIHNYPCKMTFFEFILYELIITTQINYKKHSKRIFDIATSASCLKVINIIMDQKNGLLIKDIYKTTLELGLKSTVKKLILKKLTTWKINLDFALLNYIPKDVYNLIWNIIKEL